MRFSRPIHYRDVVLLQPFLGHFSHVSGRRVSLKVKSEFNNIKQVVSCGHHKMLRDVLVHRSGHWSEGSTTVKHRLRTWRSTPSLSILVFVAFCHTGALGTEMQNEGNLTPFPCCSALSLPAPLQSLLLLSGGEKGLLEQNATSVVQWQVRSEISTPTSFHW